MRELWDTSALILAARDRTVAAELADALGADEVATTEPILLEYLNGARNMDEYRRFKDALAATKILETTPEAWQRALGVHALLAESGPGHQRSVRLVDLIVAAVAELRGFPVVHCDTDYERISRLTKQPTRWIGPRATIEVVPAPHSRSLAASLRDKVRAVADDSDWEAVRERADSMPDPDRTP